MNKDFSKRVISLGLSAVLTLSACSSDGKKSVDIGTSNNIIYYVDGALEGNIKYSDMEKSLKVVTLQREDIVMNRLMSVKVTHFFGNYGNSDTRFSYIDLETGVTMIEYSYPYYKATSEQIHSTVPTYSVGEEMVIIEEKDFTKYLLQEEIIKEEYSINELLEFFNEIVLPSIEEKNVLTK